MKILYSLNGLILKPETTEEAFEMGSLWSMRNSLPGPMSEILSLRDDGTSFLINHKYTECLEKQLKIVDDTLRWEGTGESRVEKIKRLMHKEAGCDD